MDLVAELIRARDRLKSQQDALNVANDNLQEALDNELEHATKAFASIVKRREAAVTATAALVAELEEAAKR